MSARRKAIGIAVALVLVTGAAALLDARSRQRRSGSPAVPGGVTQAPPPKAAERQPEPPRGAAGRRRMRVYPLRPSAAAQARRSMPRTPMPALPPAEPWSGPWPESLAALPKTPATERALASVDGLGRDIFDYKLALLGAIDRCVAGRVGSTGDLDLSLNFRVDPETLIGSASDIEIRESSLAEQDDPIVIDCVTRLHTGFLKMPGYPSEGIFYWATAIHIPTKNDRVYPSLMNDQKKD